MPISVRPASIARRLLPVPPSNTRGGSPVREYRPPGSVRGHAVTRAPTAILDPKRKVRMQFRWAGGDPFRTSSHKSSFCNDSLPFKMPGGRRA
jgi:hypothetical protein